MVMPVSLLAPANAFCPMVVSWLPDAKVTVARALAAMNAKSPMEVTTAGIVALPAQSLCLVTTLSVIVNVPLIEHATVVVAACATLPRNPNNITLMIRSVSIRWSIFFLAQKIQLPRQ
jgi:hypothetical protein